MVPECNAEGKGENILLLLTYDCKEFFLGACWTRVFNIQREGKKEMLEEEIGSEGEAKLDMVLSGALNTFKFTYSLVSFESEKHIETKLLP